MSEYKEITGQRPPRENFLEKELINYEKIIKDTNKWLTLMTLLCVIFFTFSVYLLVHNYTQKEEIQDLTDQLENVLKINIQQND